MKTFFSIDNRITIGELITVISIVFSAISVLITWRNEQRIQILENATRTRVEIAKTLNTVNQVIQIQLSFYELIEEDIVEASRIVIVEKEPFKARDYMWEKLFRHRGEILNIISQNEWEIAYTNLPLRAFEKEIMEFKPSSPDQQTTALIDRLRELKKTFRESHHEYSKIATSDLNSFCLKLINETDKKLIFNADVGN
jgi:hypothetical protein